MSREAVGMALEAMADEDVRSRVESGDLSGVPGADDLTAEETTMVIEAAAEYPDTGGFALDAMDPDIKNKFSITGLGGSFGNAAQYAGGFKMPGGDASLGDLGL
jgi:hypothetical protein